MSKCRLLESSCNSGNQCCSGECSIEGQCVGPIGGNCGRINNCIIVGGGGATCCMPEFTDCCTLNGKTATEAMPCCADKTKTSGDCGPSTANQCCIDNGDCDSGLICVDGRCLAGSPGPK